MAAPTMAQIRTRVEQMLDDIPGLGLLTGAEDIIAASTLPAAQVGKIRASIRAQAHGQQIVTLNVPILVVVRMVAKIESDTDRQAALEVAEGWIFTIADYFMARPQLQRNDAGIAVGMDALEFTEPDTTPYKESASGEVMAFSGVIPVIIRRYSSV